MEKFRFWYYKIQTSDSDSDVNSDANSDLKRGFGIIKFRLQIQTSEIWIQIWILCGLFFRRFLGRNFCRNLQFQLTISISQMYFVFTQTALAGLGIRLGTESMGARPNSPLPAPIRLKFGKVIEPKIAKTQVFNICHPTSTFSRHPTELEVVSFDRENFKGGITPNPATPGFRPFELWRPKNWKIFHFSRFQGSRRKTPVVRANK